MRRIDQDKLNMRNDYIALLDLDFSWASADKEEVKQYWQEGESIEYISRQLEREIDEVFLLLMDLARKEEIEDRGNGIWGA